MIFQILKTILGKDANPSELSKPWYLKRRYWGLALTLLGSALYSWRGLVLDNDMKDLILDNLEVIKTSIDALISAITALLGVYTLIRGQMGATSKLKQVANTLAVSPQACNVPFPNVEVHPGLAVSVANQLDMPCPDEVVVTKRNEG